MKKARPFSSLVILIRVNTLNPFSCHLLRFVYTVHWRPHCNENPIDEFPENDLRDLSPKSTFMCLWAIYIFSGQVHIFSCSWIGRPIMGIYKSPTDTRKWKLGLRLCNSFSRNICFECSMLCLCRACDMIRGYSSYWLLTLRGWERSQIIWRQKPGPLLIINPGKNGPLGAPM